MTVVEGTFGGLVADEIEIFRRLLAGKDGMAVEIGCLDGFSSTAILDVSSMYLCSIDPFIPDSMEASLIGSEARYLANVAPYEHRWELIKDYSWNVVAQWSRVLDLLFIDGDHTYNAVARDFDDWTPHIRCGGLLAMHDSRMSRPNGAPFHHGPSRVADERVYSKPDQWEVVGEAWSLTVARKL